MKPRITYRVTSKGKRIGRCGLYYITLWRRPMGHWSAIITLRGEYVASEGIYGSYLKTLTMAKQWVKTALLA